jgi:RNA polymerase sporulation-specific sigma factor
MCGSGSFPTQLSPEQERECLEAYSKGCKEARNTLIERNLRLVPFSIRKYTNHAKDSEDLISVGIIGLIKAVDNFDPTRNIRLATYAIRCIDNEILMYIRAGRKRVGDIYLQDVVGVDREGNEVRVEDKIADDKDPIDDQVGLAMQLNKLRDAVERTLEGREKQVIELRYGLNNNDELTQREIAGLLDISRSYVSRIEKKAVGKLIEAM